MTTATPDRPALRPLSPQFFEEQHGEYVDVLVAELSKGPTPSTGGARNIALTGHYGSGKSSVLIEVERRLKDAKKQVINLSLPSLGVGDGRLLFKLDPGHSTTNLIQKEIVKQLLYRQEPADTPASRYSRLDVFHPWWSLLRAVPIALGVTLISLLLHVPTKVHSALPETAWTWLDDNTWSHTAVSLQWGSLLVVFALFLLLSLWVQRLLQQRIRVTEFGAGSTKVTLSEKSSSYFDEYLDEIVYFFQISKTTVVIFEDLDRFDDPHIFETLRELNLLLNNSEQTGATPIRFVYAIKDSIFEQLDDDSDTRDAADVRRLTSTNRTKFFDLVIPMVPFISHRTSRSLITDELESISIANQRPSTAVVDLVSSHLTDMRLIKNICNEYDIFRPRLLGAGRLDELDADRLFASIVYKNLYLADYEKIRIGSSQLDVLYRTYRQWVATRTTAERAEIHRLRRRLATLNSLANRSDSLGERLQSVVLIASRLDPRDATVSASVGVKSYNWDEFKQAAFWQQLLSTEDDLNVNYTMSGYGTRWLLSWSFSQVATMLGRQLSLADWTETDRNDLQHLISAARERQLAATHASLAQALSSSDGTVTFDAEQLTLEDVADRLFDGAELVLELLHAGFIDENYTLYTTQFPDGGSPAAWNFVMKAVQRDQIDVDYHFGSEPAERDKAILEVLTNERGRLLSGQSIYNIELFDYLLQQEPGALTDPIHRLAINADDDQDFIDAYLTSGAQATSFVHSLAAEWSGVFEYLLERGEESVESLSAALLGANPDRAYRLSDEHRASLAETLGRLAAIHKVQSNGQAIVIARVLQSLSVDLPVLADAAEPLRQKLVRASLYPLNLENLRTVAGDDEHLPLDRLRDDIGSSVYEYALSRLTAYLEVTSEAPGVPTVAGDANFVAVLTDVGKVDADRVQEVARRAANGCIVDDLTDIESKHWPALALAQRFTLDLTNVAAYVDEDGFDEPLTSYLIAGGAIEPDDRSLVASFALQLLNLGGLERSLKLKLADSLAVAPGSVAASDLRTEAHGLIPSAVARTWIPDDASAYAVLGEDEWAIKKALIEASDEFPVYMAGLGLSQRDLFDIADARVSARVLNVLLEDFHTFDVELGPRGAAALARWVADSGHSIDNDVLLALAVKADSGGRDSVIKLLAGAGQSLSIADLRTALQSFGGDYARVTIPGRDRPTVTDAAGMQQILQRLKVAGPVSSIRLDERRGIWRISKHRS